VSSSIDQQFVEFVVKSLVSKPDEVKVDRRIDEKGVLLELTVDPDDLGRVIGKRGGTAQSIRTLLRALGTKNEARYNLKIVDNGPAPNERSDRQRSDKSENSREDKVSFADDSGEKSRDTRDDAAENDIEEKEGEDVLAKTRKELADLDDLDV
jgi:predicted RNA-binding protein YlqC (UPF0109 family)